MQDNSRASSANTIGWVGGGIAVVALVVTIFFNLQSKAPSTILPLARGGSIISEADASQTSRIDDLAQRLTNLNARITSLMPPRRPAQ